MERKHMTNLATIEKSNNHICQIQQIQTKMLSLQTKQALNYCKSILVQPYDEPYKILLEDFVQNINPITYYNQTQEQLKSYFGGWLNNNYKKYNNLENICHKQEISYKNDNPFYEIKDFCEVMKLRMTQYLQQVQKIIDPQQQATDFIYSIKDINGAKDKLFQLSQLYEKYLKMGFLQIPQKQFNEIVLQNGMVIEQEILHQQKQYKLSSMLYQIDEEEDLFGEEKVEIKQVFINEIIDPLRAYLKENKTELQKQTEFTDQQMINLYQIALQKQNTNIKELNNYLDNKNYMTKPIRKQLKGEKYWQYQILFEKL